jgi:fructokinase
VREAAAWGGIEAGGTKFLCAAGSDPLNLLAEARFETTTPEETLQQVCDFFLPFIRSGQVQRIGVGSFGPLDLDPASASYGRITSTPKPGWQNVDLIGILHDRLNVDVALDTDVNAAALGEHLWGASRGLDPSLYLTVGTGIGGGLITGGKPYHGLLTPEMGHLRIPHDRGGDPFGGACPYHGDCLEGLAAGPAIQARTGMAGEALPDDHPFWELEAGYLAYALANYILTLSPRRIILGGGVMQREFLLARVRAGVREALNGYVQHELITQHIEDYLLPPGLGKRAGLLGAIALAKETSI